MLIWCSAASEARPPMPVYADDLTELAAQLHAASLEQGRRRPPPLVGFVSKGCRRSRSDRKTEQAKPQATRHEPIGTLSPMDVVGTKPRRSTMSGGSMNYLYLMVQDASVGSR